METQQTIPPRSPEWYELRGRLFHFCGTQPKWERWTGADGVWMCARAGWKDREPARDTRVAAIIEDPKLIPSRSIPERHHYTDVTSRGWNRVLLGIFTFLNGPALLDDIVTVAGVLLRLPGAEGLPTGVVAPDGPEEGAPHLSLLEMSRAVEGTLSAGFNLHISECTFCARQWEAYQAGAPIVSAVIKKAKKVEADTSSAPKHPGHQPGAGGISAVMKSPSLLIMIIGGVLMAVAGPYMLWRAFAPGEGNPFDEDRAVQAADIPLDLTPVDQLEEPYYSGALRILAAAVPLTEEPDPVFGDVDPIEAGELVLPEVLYPLGDPVGFGQRYPVTEAIDTTRPNFSWQPTGPPPFSAEILDSRGRVVTRAAALPNPQWLPPVDLGRGESYRWRVTYQDQSVEEASFIVLGQIQSQQWSALRSRYQESTLLLGLVAYQMGLLSTAEEYFTTLIQENPGSQQAALLLDNTFALRE